MNCTNCGNAIKEGSRFCNSCGAEVVAEIPRSSTIREFETTYPKDTGSERKNGKKIIAIILIVVCVLLCVGAGFFLMNKFGQSEPEAENVMFNDSGLLSAEKDGEYGYINKKGKWVIKAQFEDAYEFSDGLAAVAKDEKYGYIDTDGEFVIDAEFDYARSFSEGLAAVNTEDGWGFIDKKGEFVIKPKFDAVRAFSDGMAAVFVDDEIGFIDKKGEYMIRPQYESILSFVDGECWVKKNNRWGYINSKNEVLIDFKYIDANEFTEDGFADVVTEDKKHVLINKKGKEITSELDAIGSYDSTYCKEDNCYTQTSGDEYCYSHESESDYKYCDKYGCWNKAYYGDYCYDHNYLE